MSVGRFTKWRSLIDGQEALAIPDSVVTQYEFEDDSDTSTAIDSVGDNDATLSAPTYNSSTVQVGSNSLEFDGVDDELTSGSTVDLVTSGESEAVSFAGWLYPFDTDLRVPFGHWSEGGNRFYLWNDGDGHYNFGHAADTAETVVGPSITTNEWVHFYIEITQSDATMKLDNTEVASYSHDSDITELDPMTLRSGYDPFDNYANQIVDDLFAMNGTLSETEIQQLIDRA